MPLKGHRCYIFRLIVATYLLGNLLTTLSTPIPMEVAIEHSYEVGGISRSFAEDSALRGGMGHDLSHEGPGAGLVNKKSSGGDDPFLHTDHGDKFISEEHSSSADRKPTTEQKKQGGFVARLRDLKNERFRQGEALFRELFPKKTPKEISSIDSAPKKFLKTLFKPFTLLYKGLKRLLSKAYSKFTSKTGKGVEEVTPIDHADSFTASPKRFEPGEFADPFRSSSRSSADSHGGHDLDEYSPYGSPRRSSFNAEKGHLDASNRLHTQSPDDTHTPIDKTDVWDQHFKGARDDHTQTASTASTDLNPFGLGSIENEINPDKVTKAKEVGTEASATTPPFQIHSTIDEQEPRVNLNAIAELKAKLNSNFEFTPKPEHVPATTESKSPDLDSKTRVQDGIKAEEAPSNLKSESDAQPAQDLRSPPVKIAQETQNPDPIISTAGDKKVTSPVDPISSKALKIEDPPADKLKEQVSPNSDVTPKPHPETAATESKTLDLDSKTRVQDGIKAEETPLNLKTESDAQPAHELHSPPVKITQETKNPAPNANDPAISAVNDKKVASPLDLLSSKALNVENPPAVKNPKVLKTPDVLKAPEVVDTPSAANIPPVDSVKNTDLRKAELTNADQARSELSSRIPKTLSPSQEAVIQDSKVKSEIPQKNSPEAAHGNTKGSTITAKDANDLNQVDLNTHPAEAITSEKPRLSIFGALERTLGSIRMPTWLHRDPQDEEFLQELESISPKSNSLPKS
ncbi:hypothetical protein DFH28DRAFT_588280 [Melampsora americana]|nr:hypothetical protein DFH28DRAFT_588280 [Melampsora americana]